MQINRKSLAPQRTYEESRTIIFEPKLFPEHSNLKSIEDCQVEMVYKNYEDILRVELKISANLILICSYSLEDVAFHLETKDELEFTDKEEIVNENVFYEPHNVIDLNPYILGIIMASIPIKFVKEGVELPKDGLGYRVLDEEQLNEERKKRKDPRFDILDDLKLDD